MFVLTCPFPPLLSTLLLFLLLLIAFIKCYSLLLSRLTVLACDFAWVNSFFIVRFWLSTEVVYLQHWRGWCHMKLLPSRCVLCTPYNHAPCHFMQSHIHKVHACLAVTCHPHFWQNDRGLLRATAVTRGWNGYWNESTQKVGPGEENSPAAPAGIQKPMTFRSQVRRSNHWAIPTPWLIPCGKFGSPYLGKTTGR